MNTGGFTFSKILSGAYKTLNLANQIIPLYQSVSPMVRNAKNTFAILKEFKKVPTIKTNKTITNNYQKKELSLNNPVFFH